MKLLTENSVLKRIPKSIVPKQLIVLDAMRFTIEIIQENYDELLQSLTKLSIGQQVSIPKTFNAAWNIIDNIQRLNEIYKKMPRENEPSLFKDVSIVKFFRHSYQHLEDRIEEIIFDKRIPIFGVIKWGINDNGNILTGMAISGKWWGRETTTLIPSDVVEETLISRITLTSTIRQKPDTESKNQTFEKEINISDLMLSLKDNIDKLEIGIAVSLEASGLLQKQQSELTDIVVFFRTE